MHLLDWVNRVALTAWLQAPKWVIHLVCRVAVVIIRVDNNLVLCLLSVAFLFLTLSLSFFLDLFVPFLREGHRWLCVLLISGSWLFAEFWRLPDALDDLLPTSSFDFMLAILNVVRGSILHGQLELGLRVQIPCRDSFRLGLR